MANSMTIINNTSADPQHWKVNYEVDNSGLTIATLNTAGTFVDRNIQIAITTPAGNAQVDGGGLSVVSNYSATPNLSVTLDAQTTSGITITDTAPTSGYYVQLTGKTSALSGLTTVNKAATTLTLTSGYIAGEYFSGVLTSASASPTVTVSSASKTRYLQLPAATFTTSGASIYSSAAGWVAANQAINSITVGSVSATTAAKSNATANMSATGFTKASSGSYYVTLTTTAGSVTPRAVVTTSGYVTDTQNTNGTAVSVGVTATTSKIYIPTNSITGSIVDLTVPSIDITTAISTGISTTSTATDYFVSINNTITDGSVKGKATAGNTTGIVAANAANTSTETTITPSITGGNTTIYIPEATLVASALNASATTTVAPSTVSIATNTAAVSGKTRIAITPVTSTSTISTYYLALKATAAANTTGTTSNISGTATASVGTEGYAPSGLATSVSITGTAKAITSLKDSSVYYLPIPTASFNTSGATVYCATSGWVPTGSASSGIGTIPNGTLSITGGGLTASTGSASLASSGYYNGTSYDTADTVALSTTEASGYYKLVASGSGKVTRAAISKQITSAGYFAADANAVQQIASSTGTSNVGTANYYIKKSTLSTASVNSSSVAQSITISSGYYPTNRTITINAMATQTPTTTYTNSGLSTYFNSGSSSSYNISITPQYSNNAGYVAAHTNTNNGGVGYWNIKTTTLNQGTTTVSNNIATRGTASISSSGWIESTSIPAATFSNVATTGITYVNISNTPDAPILDAEGNLYINKGYVDNLQISLARLIPDDANVDSSATMLQGTTAYDKNGKLWTGSIATFTPNAKYYATTSDQTISTSGKYINNNIIISKLTSSNYTAANIRKGATISVNNGSGNVYSVAGTFTSANTVSSGQTAAAAAQILNGYSAWVNGAEVKGSIQNATVTTNGDTVTISSGYLSSSISTDIDAGAYSADYSTSTNSTVTPSVTISSASTYGFTSSTLTGTYLTIDPGATATAWSVTPRANITSAGYLGTGNTTGTAASQTPSINAGTNWYVPVITPAFSGGSYTTNTNTNTVTTAPVVTITGTGTLITSGSSYGVTETKPSGTDGTNYLTVDGTGSVTTTGTITSNWKVTKAANTYSANYKGVVNLASGGTAITATTASGSSAISVTPTVTDNFTPRYIPIVTPQFNAGGYTTNTNTNTVTAPTVTIASNGSLITNSATYGLTTTAISGTDGTNYLTIDAVPTTTTGQAVSSWKVTKAASTYSATYQGLVNLTSGATVVASASISDTKSTTITPTVTDNFPKYYIPIVSAPTFNGGIPTVNLSSNTVTSSNVTTTTTGTYFITVTAKGTATRSAVTYSNGAGVIAAHNGASALTATTSTESSTATTIYIPTASITASSSALTVGSAGMTAVGFTEVSSGSYYVSLTTTAGSLTPKATVTSGYTTGGTINGNAISIGVSTTNPNGRLYIPTASISTITTTAYTAPSVAITTTAPNITTTTSTSDYYITIGNTNTNGSVKAYAKTNTTTGIIAANTTATQTTATTITPNVTGTKTIYIPAANLSFSGGTTSITAYTGTPTVTLASNSNTNMANITIGALSTATYPYYFQIKGSTNALSGSTNVQVSARTATLTSGYTPGSTSTALSAINSSPSVTINSTSATTYISLKKATMTVSKTTGVITASASMAGTNATLSDTDNGIKVVATGGGSASLTAKATTNAAGYAPASTDLGSADLSIANTTTSATKYISGVKLEAPSSGTRSFTITVPNGNTTDFIDFVFTVDSSGNVTVAGPD